ncbi:MAG: DUF2007 domain-containing protein [Bacillota bacterium]
MDRLTLLSTFLNPGEAHIAKGLLDNEGVESFVFDELSSTYTPLLVRVRLMVRESDLDKAKKILSEMGTDN